MNRKILTIACLSLAPACADDAGEAKRASAPPPCTGDAIEITEPWIKPARAGQPVTAAYLTICNGGSENDALVGVAYDGAKATEIHLSEMTDDVMSMRRINEFSLPAGEVRALAPGGAHIMIMGVSEAIEAGGTVSLTLEFEQAPPQTIDFEARAPESGDPR